MSRLGGCSAAANLDSGGKKKIKYQLGKQSLQGAGNRSPEELARSVCHRECNSIPLSLSTKGKKRKKFPTRGCTRAGQKGSGAPSRAASHKSGAEHPGADVPDLSPPSPPLPVTSSVPAVFFFLPSNVSSPSEINSSSEHMLRMLTSISVTARSRDREMREGWCTRVWHEEGWGGRAGQRNDFKVVFPSGSRIPKPFFELLAAGASQQYPEQTTSSAPSAKEVAVVQAQHR